ncbi:MAG TPA: M23 family metallopeptidase, partial [Candidatus Omnitrophota bacterium]|nr:M23 family metallopeptidase [Candidatus Omnitrophota bacterium]
APVFTPYTNGLGIVDALEGKHEEHKVGPKTEVLEAVKQSAEDAVTRSVPQNAKAEEDRTDAALAQEKKSSEDPLLPALPEGDVSLDPTSMVLPPKDALGTELPTLSIGEPVEGTGMFRRVQVSIKAKGLEDVQATKYGYQSDEHIDSNSLNGIGHSNNRLVKDVSVALMAETANALGVSSGDLIVIRLKNGQTLLGRYDDTIPSLYKGHRVDFYTPSGELSFDGQKVELFSYKQIMSGLSAEDQTTIKAEAGLLASKTNDTQEAAVAGQSKILRNMSTQVELTADLRVETIDGKKTLVLDRSYYELGENELAKVYLPLMEKLGVDRIVIKGKQPVAYFMEDGKLNTKRFMQTAAHGQTYRESGYYGTAVDTKSWIVTVQVPFASPVRTPVAGNVAAVALTADGWKVTVQAENKIETIFTHLGETAVKAGETLAAGDLIGLAGEFKSKDAKEYHFRIQVKEDGKEVNLLKKNDGASTIEGVRQAFVKNFNLDQAEVDFYTGKLETHEERKTEADSAIADNNAHVEKGKLEIEKQKIAVEQANDPEQIRRREQSAIGFYLFGKRDWDVANPYGNANASRSMTDALYGTPANEGGFWFGVGFNSIYSTGVGGPVLTLGDNSFSLDISGGVNNQFLGTWGQLAGDVFGAEDVLSKGPAATALFGISLTDNLIKLRNTYEDISHRANQYGYTEFFDQGWIFNKPWKLALDTSRVVPNPRPINGEWVSDPYHHADFTPARILEYPGKLVKGLLTLDAFTSDFWSNNPLYKPYESIWHEGWMQREWSKRAFEATDVSEFSIFSRLSGEPEALTYGKVSRLADGTLSYTENMKELPFLGYDAATGDYANREFFDVSRNWRRNVDAGTLNIVPSRSMLMNLPDLRRQMILGQYIDGFSVNPLTGKVLDISLESVGRPMQFDYFGVQNFGTTYYLDRELKERPGDPRYAWNYTDDQGKAQQAYSSYLRTPRAGMIDFGFDVKINPGETGMLVIFNADGSLKEIKRLTSDLSQLSYTMLTTENRSGTPAKVNKQLTMETYKKGDDGQLSVAQNTEIPFAGLQVVVKHDGLANKVFKAEEKHAAAGTVWALADGRFVEGEIGVVIPFPAKELIPYGRMFSDGKMYYLKTVKDYNLHPKVENQSYEFSIEEMDIAALRQGLNDGEKHDALVIAKLAERKVDLAQAADRDLLRAFNALLDVKDLYAQVDAGTLNLTGDVRALIVKAQANGGKLTESEYLTVNRALLLALYPQVTEKGKGRPVYGLKIEVVDANDDVVREVPVKNQGALKTLIGVGIEGTFKLFELSANADNIYVTMDDQTVYGVQIGDTNKTIKRDNLPPLREVDVRVQQDEPSTRVEKFGDSLVQMKGKQRTTFSISVEDLDKWAESFSIQGLSAEETAELTLNVKKMQEILKARAVRSENANKAYEQLKKLKESFGKSTFNAHAKAFNQMMRSVVDQDEKMVAMNALERVLILVARDRAKLEGKTDDDGRAFMAYLKEEAKKYGFGNAVKREIAAYFGRATASILGNPEWHNKQIAELGRAIDRNVDLQTPNFVPASEAYGLDTEKQPIEGRIEYIDNQLNGYTDDQGEEHVGLLDRRTQLETIRDTRAWEDPDADVDLLFDYTTEIVPGIAYHRGQLAQLENTSLDYWTRENQRARALLADRSNGGETYREYVNFTQSMIDNVNQQITQTRQALRILEQHENVYTAIGRNGYQAAAWQSAGRLVQDQIDMVNAQISLLNAQRSLLVGAQDTEIPDFRRLQLIPFNRTAETPKDVKTINETRTWLSGQRDEFGNQTSAGRLNGITRDYQYFTEGIAYTSGPNGIYSTNVVNLAQQFQMTLRDPDYEYSREAWLDNTTVISEYALYTDPEFGLQAQLALDEALQNGTSTETPLQVLERKLAYQRKLQLLYQTRADLQDDMAALIESGNYFKDEATAKRINTIIDNERTFALNALSTVEKFSGAGNPLREMSEALSALNDSLIMELNEKAELRQYSEAVDVLVKRVGSNLNEYSRAWDEFNQDLLTVRAKLVAKVEKSPMTKLQKLEAIKNIDLFLANLSAKHAPQKDAYVAGQYFVYDRAAGKDAMKFSGNNESGDVGAVQDASTGKFATYRQFNLRDAASGNMIHLGSVQSAVPGAAQNQYAIGVVNMTPESQHAIFNMGVGASKSYRYLQSADPDKEGEGKTEHAALFFSDVAVENDARTLAFTVSGFLKPNVSGDDALTGGLNTGTYYQFSDRTKVKLEMGFSGADRTSPARLTAIDTFTGKTIFDETVDINNTDWFDYQRLTFTHALNKNLQFRFGATREFEKGAMGIAENVESYFGTVGADWKFGNLLKKDDQLMISLDYGFNADREAGDRSRIMLQYQQFYTSVGMFGEALYYNAGVKLTDELVAEFGQMKTGDLYGRLGYDHSGLRWDAGMTGKGDVTGGMKVDLLNMPGFLTRLLKIETPKDFKMPELHTRKLQTLQERIIFAPMADAQYQTVQMDVPENSETKNINKFRATVNAVQGEIVVAGQHAIAAENAVRLDPNTPAAAMPIKKGQRLLHQE